MHKYKIETQVLLISLFLILIGLIVFGGLAVIDYSWIVGWVVGATSIVAAYSIGLLLIRKLPLKKISRKSGFWLTILRVAFTYIFQFGFIIAIVAIDKSFHNVGLTDNGHIDYVLSPINIFTYIGGISVIGLATVMAHILYKKGE